MKLETRADLGLRKFVQTQVKPGGHERAIGRCIEKVASFSMAVVTEQACSVTCRVRPSMLWTALRFLREDGGACRS